MWPAAIWTDYPVCSPERLELPIRCRDNYLHIGFLRVLFPNARIIHCRRDLRDIAVSCWITNFRAIRWASKEEHIAERIREYLRVTEHWRRVLPNRMLEVQYEELVENPEVVVRQLLDRVGIDWEEACLKFYERPRPVRTASVVQVREPVNRHSVGRWRRYDPLLRNLFERLPSNGPATCDSPERQANADPKAY